MREERRAYGITDAPGGDGSATSLVQASAENSCVVVGRGLLDIELSNGNLTISAGKSVDRSSSSTSTVGLKGRGKGKATEHQT